MCRFPEPIHILAQGEGTSPVPTTEENRQLLLDVGSRQDLGGYEDALGDQPNPRSPNVDELMLLYISTTNQVVSVVLVVERDKEVHAYKVQCPVYYFSEVLSPCKTWYPHYQKIAYAIFMASQKLRHYF